MADLDRQHFYDRGAGPGSSDLETAAVDCETPIGQACPMGFDSRSSEIAENRPLSELLRERTALVHTEAERTGVIAGILRREADRHAYALLLRNILPAYERLEVELSAHSSDPVLGVFADPTLMRSDRLRHDLARIEGIQWEQNLPVLGSGAAYANCIERAAAGNGLRLVSHAYVRYFGDLSGGQILKKLLGKSLSLPADALTFYDFPGLDPHSLKTGMRDALDQAGCVSDDPEMLVLEAISAFEHNIDVSREVQEHASATVSAPD